MCKSVVAQLAELERLDIAGLQERWTWLFGTEAPGYSRVFLVKRLACRLQELAYGGLREEVGMKLRQALADAGLDEDGRAVKVRPRGMPITGTRLIREWNGRRHEVTVVSGGFEYQGRRYKSLSAIARQVTGTRWNGPLFFGLRKERAG
jgi:hypothetical protein